MPKRGVNLFNDSWHTEGHFKIYLVKISSTATKCKWCVTTLDIRNIGVASFSDHAKYKNIKSKSMILVVQKALCHHFLVGCCQVRLCLIPLSPVKFKVQ